MKALTEYIFRAKLNIDMQECSIMDDYSITLAESEEDIAVAFSVREQVYVKETRWENETDKDKHDDQSIFIIARRGTIEVGCLRVIMRGSTIDPSRVEFSRLCVLKEHRTTGVVICMYLAAQIILEKQFGINEAVFITKPSLANSIGLVLGKIKKLGTVREHRGLRAPYLIKFKPPVAPGLRNLHQIVKANI